MSKVKVHVFLKPGVLDVQGKAVEGALHGLGWTGVTNARVGKLIEFDLVVLDVMMPGESGFDLTTWVRNKAETSKTPVLLLTAKGDPEDRIEGLSRGADDYMSKPFEPRELVLRIEAILRRTGGKPLTPREIKLGAAVFDMERLELMRDGKPQRLTEAEAAAHAAFVAKLGDKAVWLRYSAAENA